jgi:ketosteroid isomerase-like protein
VRGTIQDDATCVLEAHVTGTHTGPLASPAGEIPPTGKPFALDYVNVAHFAHGQIASETYYWDNQSFLTQLGLV